MIKKVKAFTIIELVVVMILTAIIIGIVYSAYSIVGNQYGSYKKMNTQNARVALLSMLLNKDFTASYSINKKNEVLFFYNKENKFTKYTFGEDYIIRNTMDIADTFFIPAFNLEIKFLNQLQLFQNGLVDELYFESNVFEKEQLFHFKKQYGADILMDNEKRED